MHLYPHPSDGTPVPGAVVFPYRGYDLSLSNLWGGGELRVFQAGASSGQRKDVTQDLLMSTPVPTARAIREAMAAIDKHLDQ